MRKARSWSNSAQERGRPAGKRHTPTRRIPDSTPLPFPAAETQPAREARKQSGNRPNVEKGEVVATTDSRKIRARRKQRRRTEEGPHQVASVSCRPGLRHRSPRTAKLTPPPTLSSRVQSRDPYPCN